MENKQAIISKFADMLNKEMQDCVEQNISFKELSDIKKILILQSSPVGIFKEVLEKLFEVNNNINIILIGKEQCREVINRFPDKDINLIVHNKRFDDDDFPIIEEIMNKHKPDTAFYFNNFVSCTDFSNVEHLLEPAQKRMAIYSYSYVPQELNRHKGVSYHIYGCILYKSLLEWFKTFETGE